MAEARRVLSGILRELRSTLPKGGFKTDPSYRYVVQQYQQYQPTPNQLCRGEKLALHQASAYYCYLNSNRKHQELLSAYRGKGERSIEESAGLVGLKLPETPHD